MAHDEELGIGPPHSSLVEMKSAAVEPSRTGLLVIFEPQPEASELPNLLVLALPEIYDVRDALCAEPLDVPPALDRASKS